MLALQEIFKKYEGNGRDCWEGSDKGSAHSYVDVYAKEFEIFRDKEIRMLEIGICSGGSLVAWSDYFLHPDTEIIGVDVNLSYVKHRKDNDLRLKMYELDGTSGLTAHLLGGSFDIIIDDGCHYKQSQIASLDIFAPRLREGGIYVIEDILNFDDASLICKYGEEKHNLTGIVHDRRHIKGDQCDVMIVFKK